MGKRTPVLALQGQIVLPDELFGHHEPIVLQASQVEKRSFRGRDLTCSIGTRRGLIFPNWKSTSIILRPNMRTPLSKLISTLFLSIWVPLLERSWLPLLLACL